MKLFAISLLVWIPHLAFAQSAPSLNCVVKYKDQVSKMSWFAMNSSHHSASELEYLNIQVREKSVPGKVEIIIVESVEDATWDKFSSLVDAAKLDNEMRKNIRDLARTRVTRAFVGLYSGVLHYEFRLGTDPNLFEVSCASSAK
jgi:hypothetical protein